MERNWKYHLGLIVSGIDEELKNVDKNIKAARNTLFGFLGNIFSYRCRLSARLQYHTWQVYIKPTLCSRLSAHPLRPSAVSPLRSFHHKVLRSILKLSPHSPVVPLYFLLGELPIEASLHISVLSLFWNIKQDVATVCPLIKMLAGDYLCYYHLAHDRGTEPYCPLCKDLTDTHRGHGPPTDPM